MIIEPEINGVTIWFDSGEVNHITWSTNYLVNKVLNYILTPIHNEDDDVTDAKQIITPYLDVYGIDSAYFRNIFDTYNVKYNMIKPFKEDNRKQKYNYLKILKETHIKIS